MNQFYIIGGRQKSPRPLLENEQDWYEYKMGVILQVDAVSGKVETCVEYESPPSACAPGDPILFKAGTVEDGRLYACTQTEILVYALPDFHRLNYISLPLFNDVHHVRPNPEGNLLVANSGLEMVLEISPGGQVLQEWNVLGEDPWARFSKEIDYRKGVNLKPHRAHPNYIFTVGNDIWATRFELRDALCITNPNCRIPIEIERLHDGFLYQDQVYFTSVNGNLVITDPAAQKVVETINLNAMHPDGTLLGWCRGLYIEDDLAWIGFSRIRPTKFREAVRWARVGFKHELPTHIACYDLERRQCVKEMNLEDYGLNAVFSVLPAL